MFELGDKVHLKSGGPMMTVERIEGEGDKTKVFVRWALNGKVQRDDFPAYMLTKGNSDGPVFA